MCLLDLFLQYLDFSIAQRIREPSRGDAPIHSSADIEPTSALEGQLGDADGTTLEGPVHDSLTQPTHTQYKELEDQYFNLLYGPWEGHDGTADLRMVLQANDPMQLNNLEFLGRSL